MFSVFNGIDSNDFVLFVLVLSSFFVVSAIAFNLSVPGDESTISGNGILDPAILDEGNVGLTALYGPDSTSAAPVFTGGMPRNVAL